MNFPTSEHFPDNPDNLPPARRRRAHRLLAPLSADERARFLDRISHRASPSFDFFLLSLVSGFVISIGTITEQPPIIVLGAALAPLMAPIVGVSLGTVIGSSRLFLHSLFGSLIGCLIVLFTGWITGITFNNWLSSSLTQAPFYSQVSYVNFIILAVAAILTTKAIASSEKMKYPSILPSVALAYQLYLPLSVAGLGLGLGIPHLWPDGLIVFSLHLAWGILFGAITLAFSGFRPLTLFGYTLSGAITLLGVILLIGVSGVGVVIGTHLGLPTAVPSSTPTFTATNTKTQTPIPPTSTFTPTSTPSATLTPTNTPTRTATPMLAVVRTDLPEGARIRIEPGGETIGFLSNNALVILLPEMEKFDGTDWVRIISPSGENGWIVQTLVNIVTATPPTP